MKGQAHDILRPRSKIDKVFARRLCPERIIHPQPVSEVKPFGSTSWLRSRTLRVILLTALGSCDFGIGGKLERYVNQIRDSKSSRNVEGQPLPNIDFCDPDSSSIAGTVSSASGASIWDHADEMAPFPSTE
jgi:hypothetical protein